MIFWRSRTLLSDWIWSRSTEARSNFVSAAAASISFVSRSARSSSLPSRNRATSRTVLAYPSRVSQPVQGALHRWIAYWMHGRSSVPSIAMEHVRRGKSWRVRRSVSRIAVAG